jgi:uncharacterized protein
MISRCIIAICLSASVFGVEAEAAEPASPVFSFRQEMIPMRDGVRLQTVILAPVGKVGLLPILLQRTPYGVPDKAPAEVPADSRFLYDDGYIFVFQNVRGRFESEGKFTLSTRIAGSTNQVTDAYDTIDWLVKNLPGNNGKVGIYGVSYMGLTAAVTLIAPHPGLKAVSEQAAPANWWENDDWHHYGALRLSHLVDFSILTETDPKRLSFLRLDTYDSYDWYLKMRPLTRIDEYFKGSHPYWTLMRMHPDEDDFWKGEAWVDGIKRSPVPTLNVAGSWDEEDPWGPWKIYRSANASDPNGWNQIVEGPWNHNGWREGKGDRLGAISFGGHATGDEYLRDIEAPFFRYWLHGRGQKSLWKAKTFQTGSNVWREYAAWPPKEAKLTPLYLHGDGTLSFNPPTATEVARRDYESDPNNPVPYRPRPISPTYPGGDWPDWEVGDQRFVDHRPDVLSYVSAPLDHNIVMTGAAGATLFASTSGTDGDLITKLIDVYPESFEKHSAWFEAGNMAGVPDFPKGPDPGDYAKSPNGYELPIAMEVRRGRYLENFEKAAPLPADQVVRWPIPLGDHDHVFLQGHRIMVQVQSTWFPLIDANPQTFVADPRKVRLEDYRKARQSIYSSQRWPSLITLPIIGTEQSHQAVK